MAHLDEKFHEFGSEISSLVTDYLVECKETHQRDEDR